MGNRIWCGQLCKEHVSDGQQAGCNRKLLLDGVLGVNLGDRALALEGLVTYLHRQWLVELRFSGPWRCTWR